MDWLQPDTIKKLQSNHVVIEKSVSHRVARHTGKGMDF